MTTGNPVQNPSALEVERITYALSRHLPEIRSRGCTLTTAYGELVIEAGEAAMIARATEWVLKRRLRATRAPGEDIMAAQALAADQPHPSIFSTEESGIIKAALNLIEEKRLRGKELLYYFEDFQRYLILRFAGLTNEQGHVLYLNTNCELLAAETEFFGHQSAVQWDMRKVVLRAITLGAEHVVFAHNHPTDNPQPSDADLLHLDWSIKTLQPLNINLLDSYVVTARGITSIKDVKKRQEEARWAEQRADRERRSAERRAKLAATKARKAADRETVRFATSGTQPTPARAHPGARSAMHPGIPNVEELAKLAADFRREPNPSPTLA